MVHGTLCTFCPFCTFCTACTPCTLNLPARLGHTRNLPPEGQHAEADSAHAKSPEIAARSAAEPAPVIPSDPKLRLLLRFQDEGLFCHDPPPQDRKGNPTCSSRAFASSSFRAVGWIQISIPRTISTFSYLTSGQMSCSLTPSA